MLVVEGPFECPQDRLRQAQGERIWEARLRWGVGDAMADGETPRASPLWIPAFAGMTRVGECGPARAGGVGGPFDRLRANGLGERACGGEWGMRWGDGAAPRGAPLDSCLRRNDACGGG